MTTPLRVLIVEDSADDTMLLVRALRRGGYDVTHERVDTPAAMRAALENREWDVITSDHSMPNFSAPAALALAKELRPQLPFLIISNEIDLNLAVSLMRTGAHDYIQKGELARAVPAIERELREVEMRRERKAAEAALRESELRLHMFFSESLDGCFFMMLDEPVQWDETVDKQQVLEYVFAHQRITRVNDAMLAQYGATREQFIGLTPNDFFAHNLVHGKDLWERFFDAGRIHLESDERKFDGTPMWVEGDYICIYTADGRITGHFGVQRDVTERKRTEAALRRESAFSHTIISQAAEGICACHATPEYPFVAFTIWNDRMTEITGYAMEEINRLGWYQTIYPNPEVRERAAERMARMRQGDDILAEEWVITRADGEKRSVLISTSLLATATGETHALALMQDITDRKRAEKAQERLFNYSIDMLCIADFDGYFKQLNPAWERTLGWTKEELMGRPYLEFVHPEDRDATLVTAGSLTEGREAITFENRYLCKDGGYKWISWNSFPIVEEGLVFAVARDITERKQVEGALKESEERYRALIEQSLMGVAVVQDERCVYVNPRLADTLGYTQDELLRMSPIEIVAAADRARVTASLRQRLAGEMEDAHDIFRIVRKDNKIIEVELYGKVIQYQGHRATLSTLIDITEQKRLKAERLDTEEALRLSEKNLKKAQHVAHVGSWEWNIKTNHLEWSDEMYAIFGVARETFSGVLADVIAQAIHPDDRPAVESSNLSVIQQGIPIALEYRIIRPDGTVRVVWAEAGELLQDEAGTPALLTGIVQDITERKQAEAALRESEEKYRTVANFTHDWEYWIDPKGNFIYVSPACERITGYRPEEFVNDPALLESILHPADRAGYLRHRELDNEWTFDFRILTRAGETRWIGHRCQEVRAADGQQLGRRGSNQDITERKRAEAELQQREAYLRSILDNFPYLVWLKDTAGRFQAVNRAFAQASNQAGPDALPGKTDLDIWPRNLAEQYRADDQAVMDARTQKSVEELIADQGVEKWFETFKSPVLDTHDQVIGTTGFAHDITERKQMELRLRQAYEQIQAQYEELQAQHEEVTTINADIKRAEEAMRQYAQRLEFLREVEQAILATRLPEAIAEAALKNLRAFLACDRASVVTFDHAAQIALILAVDVNGQTSLWQGQQMTFADFGIVPILQTGQPDLVPDLATQTDLPPVRRQLLAAGMHSILNIPLLVEGQLIGALNLADARPGVFLPEHVEVVSEVALSLAIAIQQAQLREEIQRHAEALEQRVLERTSQLEAINQELEAFSYSVSHDLRAPLRRMDGYSAALLEDYTDKLDAEGQRHLQRIRAGCQRMNELTEDLLELSRLTQHDLHRQPIDLSTLAKTVVVELQQSQPERAAEFIIADGLTANADARLLRIVLENLLGNAWKFTARQAKARIEFGITSDFRLPILALGKASPESKSPKSEIQNRKSVYFVRDNGAGFDMAHADRLFGAFQRLHTDQEFAGTGIGLATVRRIIHRHGGRVWAEGAVNAGATIYFTL